MTLSVGIEGPVLAGKSTLASKLAQRLQAEGIACRVVPCFVDTAREHHLSLPDAVTPSFDMRLRAVQFYAEIDRLRRHDGAVDVALFDRTCWTLLAHTASLNNCAVMLRGIRRAANLKPLSPDYMVYLDVPIAEQLLRARSRPPLPPPFLDAEFNSRFRSYFWRTRHVHNALWVDATNSVADITRAGEAYVMAAMTGRGKS